jgi:hypothetical protein
VIKHVAIFKLGLQGGDDVVLAIGGLLETVI